MRDTTCEKKWVFFPRYFPLSWRMKGWAFLHSNETPKHLGDAKPPVYQAVLTAVDRIGVDLDLLPNHSVDLSFYLSSPLPPSGCLVHSSGNGGSLLPFYGTRSGATSMVVSVRTGNAISWRIAYGVVKTRAYLKSWRRLTVSDRCAGCGETETISHAFCACNLVSPVWSWVSKLINKFYDTPIFL